MAIKTSENVRSVLVTGATGFLGSAVVSSLRKRNIQVTALSRTPKTATDGVMCALADILDYEATAEFIARNDIVIHLAGLVGNTPCDTDISLAVNANVLGTLNVLDAMKFFKVPGVYASVGNIEDRTIYSITKATGERFVGMFNKEYSTKILPTRIFNVYGPGQSVNSGKLISTAINKALSNEPITIYGDGSQLMDFIYVEDAAELLVDAALKASLMTNFEAVDIGTSSAVSVLETVKTIIELTRSKSEIIFDKSRPGSIQKSVVADPARVWMGDLIKPRKLREGLELTIQKWSKH